MDSRKKKTRHSIQNAFCLLRQNKSTHHIRVREICELARINKSTFYRHYDDIYALEQEVENRLIEDIVWDICSGPSIWDDSAGFLAALDTAFNGEKTFNRKTCFLGKILSASSPW